MLEKLIKHYKIIAVIFFGIIYAVFFYLAAESIDGSKPIEDEKPKARREETDSYETTVTLEIERNGSKNLYTKKLLSTNNFGDFLETLREEGTINYETIAYSNGTRISELNGVKNNNQYEWKLYINDESQEVLDMLNKEITKNAIFKLKFTRI